MLTSRPGLERYFAEVAEHLGDRRSGPGSLELVNQIGAKYALKRYPSDEVENLT